MPKHSRHFQTIANTFGIFGYASALFQWVWSGILFLPLLLNSPLRDLFLPQHEAAASVSFTFATPPAWLSWLIVAVSFIMLGFVAYALSKVPAQFGRSLQKTTRSTASSIAAHTRHHHAPLTAKSQRRLTKRLVKLIKLLIVIVPCVVALFELPEATTIPRELAIFIATTSAMISLVWFSLQMFVAKQAHIKSEQLY